MAGSVGVVGVEGMVLEENAVEAAEDVVEDLGEDEEGTEEGEDIGQEEGIGVVLGGENLVRHAAAAAMLMQRQANQLPPTAPRSIV